MIWIVIVTHNGLNRPIDGEVTIHKAINIFNQDNTNHSCRTHRFGGVATIKTTQACKVTYSQERNLFDGWKLFKKKIFRIILKYWSSILCLNYVNLNCPSSAFVTIGVIILTIYEIKETFSVFDIR